MIIGVPREIKDKEFRVGIVPAGVRKLAESGHQVLVESGAGLGSGILDREFESAGATVVQEAEAVYKGAELVVKVKEPLVQEYACLREGLILFTYLHLAPLQELTRVLLDKKVIAIAYETVGRDNKFLPLLAPMSEVAGRMSIQVGAHYLEKEAGGRGILLGGATGVEPGHVVILGSGTVGSNAARMAVGLGASVTIMGRNSARLAALDRTFPGKIKTRLSSRENIAEEIGRADLVIGAVLVPGAAAPKLITRDMLPLMQKGAVLVDVSIDQGGCIESSRPTTHSDPVYEVEGIIHYCVANMPGAVPRTSTFALTNATQPFVLAIADKGLRKAILEDQALKRGINTYRGFLTNREVAAAQQREFTDIDTLLPE
ncbi:MAG: alanine dehydrogenase [Desulfobacterales bacterium SG8_35]|nr:MAG: alanine dehydrogenase [Desulfobacterales bacterium SG8_35]